MLAKENRKQLGGKQVLTPIPSYNFLSNRLQQLSNASENGQTKHGHVDTEGAGGIVTVFVTTSVGVAAGAALISLLVVAGARGLALNLIFRLGIIKEVAEV